MRLHGTISWSPKWCSAPLWLLLAGWSGVCWHPSAVVAQQAPTKSFDVKFADDEDQQSEARFVTLTVDYGDGFQKRFVKIAWRKRLTVLDVMEAAKKHKRANFDFDFRGRGATALLLKIDDVANEGGGQRNWVYSVNKRKGDRSFGIYRLQPGDEVLWRFETYL